MAVASASAAFGQTLRFAEATANSCGQSTKVLVQKTLCDTHELVANTVHLVHESPSFKPLCVALAMCAGYCALGALFYHEGEGWSALDSVYFW